LVIRTRRGVVFPHWGEFRYPIFSVDNALALTRKRQY
jgi:hypothetical protein